MVRSDALENRSRILEAARRAFMEDGAVSMNQVAQLAGVGAGTLYRNYPTREALVLAVYQAEVDELVDAAPRLLETLAPREALRCWIGDLVGAMRRKHGLGDALSPAAHQSITDQTYGPVVAAIGQLLHAGQRDGTIRPDADPRDVLHLTGALWRAAEDRTEPMLGLVLDGLTAPTRA